MYREWSDVNAHFCLVFKLFKIRSKIDSYLLYVPRKLSYEAVCPWRYVGVRRIVWECIPFPFCLLSLISGLVQTNRLPDSILVNEWF